MYKVGDEVFIKAKIGEVDDCPLERLSYGVYFECGGSVWVNERDIVKAKTYEQGLSDAWKLAKKLFAEYKDSELCEIFGKGWSYPKLMEFTYEEALAKIEAYEKEKEIKVGDEVRTEDGSTYWIIAINDYCIFGYASGKNDICFPVQKLEGLILTKTGRTTDAIDFLRQIGE